MTESKLRFWEIALLFALAAALMWGSWSLQQQDRLARKMIRLHVIANSDSEADQALKLQVRDRVLTLATDILRRADSREQAERDIEAALPDLQAAAAVFSERPLRVGGHSKGGNLAVYSAVFCSEAVQNQLMQVYNNDGPGFRTSLLPLPEHKRVAGRIVTIIPESSVVGILLEHEERCEVVRSTQIGLMQHDGFSWQVRGERFEHLPDRTEGGKLVDETLRAFIVSLSDEQRVAFIDALFDILTCTDADTLTDLKDGGLRTAAAMVKKYRTLDKDTRQALGSTLRLFMKAGAKTAASELNPVQLLLRYLPLQKLAEGLESQKPADVPEK